MHRISVEPRQGWPAIIEEQGLIYWKTELPDGSVMPYWHESNAYTLTSDEVYEMEASVRLLMEMLVEAGDYIIESNLFSQMGIPGWAVPRIKETWESEPPMLYGRFDFAYGPDGFKMLEYNADTPTALVETAVQWHWVQDVYGAGGDQWNMVHELLVQRWKELLPRLPGDRTYFVHTTAENSGEDFMTVGYMIEVAREAGLVCELMPIEAMGFHEQLGFLVSCEVPTTRHLGPGAQVGKQPRRPLARRVDDLGREDPTGSGDVDRLPRRRPPAIRALAPVEAHRGGDRFGGPIHRQVVAELVLGEAPLDLAVAVAPAPVLLD